jgi:hypothetical protein
MYPKVVLYLSCPVTAVAGRCAVVPEGIAIAPVPIDDPESNPACPTVLIGIIYIPFHVAVFTS